jgi:flagellar biosynthesis component FlhA
MEGECAEWVTEALARLAQEVECAGDHWRDNGDTDEEQQMNIILHLQQIAVGCRYTAQTILDHMSEHAVIETMRHYFAEQMGVDVEKVRATADLSQFVDWLKMGQQAQEGISEDELRRFMSEQPRAETSSDEGQEPIPRSDDPTES